jgi:hypothetical protein
LREHLKFVRRRLEQIYVEKVGRKSPRAAVAS